MSDSSRPHGQQPTRLLRPWDFPGKSTVVGCHCLLRYHYLIYSKGTTAIQWGEKWYFSMNCASVIEYPHRKNETSQEFSKMKWNRTWRSSPGVEGDKTPGWEELKKKERLKIWRAPQVWGMMMNSIDSLLSRDRQKQQKIPACDSHVSLAPCSCVLPMSRLLGRHMDTWA